MPALSACLWLAAAFPGAAVGGLAPCTPGRLDLRLPGGTRSFAVELADTPQARARGLMGRARLAPDQGMLFVFDAPQRAQFWMENTLIPLDMIFADATGRVTRVHARAVPLDRTVIEGGEGVKFVLEINGGLAARLGIAPGAQLRHPAIGAGAAWPCE